MALKKMTDIEASAALEADAKLVITQTEDETEDVRRVAISALLDAALETEGLAADAKAVGDICLAKIDGTITDLNDLYKNGWYFLAADSTYANTPSADAATGQRLVIVYSQRAPGEQMFKHMMYYNWASGFLAFRVYYGNEWKGWKQMASISDLSAVDGRRFQLRSLADLGVMDLNDLYAPGWYFLSANETNYSNTPPDDATSGQRFVLVYSNDSATSTSYRHMMYYNAANGFLAYRVYHSGEWRTWRQMASAENLLAVDGKRFKWLSAASQYEDPDDYDLNALYVPGWYTLGASDVYANTPDGKTGQRIVAVFSRDNAGATTFRHMLYYNAASGCLGFRVFYSGSWKKWKTTNLYLEDYDPDPDDESDSYQDTTSQIFTPSPQASQGDNIGTNLRVMSYNVARWNNNTSTYISSEKIFNLRKLIGKINADIICLEEGRPYIDGNDTEGTESCHDYLFKPQYPYATGLGTMYNPIFSKVQLANSGCVRYSTESQGGNYRVMQYATLAIGQKRLLVVATHPNWNDAGDGGTSAANIARRLTQYTELFKWANGDITLKARSSNMDVTAPEHTHVIICMDSNSCTDDDKSNLQAQAAANDFVLGNGGALGWFLTQKGTTTWNSLDVIAVSNNIIINNIESLSSHYPDLHSDHVPVFADLTLL